MKLIFASSNSGKIAEVKKIMLPEFLIIGMRDLGDIPDIVEDGETYSRNALIKAKAVFNRFKLPVVADDSGLDIDQLNGKPGVHSARFAGENVSYDDNNKKVIRLLKDYPEPHKAKFICCAVYYDGSKIIESYGKLEGMIIEESRGKNGFGYDPIFIPANSKRTLAEMTREEKNEISHRSIAFEQLKKLIIEWRKGNE
jgi:XTP/dITP diphosphohydrolase